MHPPKTLAYKQQNMAMLRKSAVALCSTSQYYCYVTLCSTRRQVLHKEATSCLVRNCPARVCCFTMCCQQKYEPAGNSATCGTRVHSKQCANLRMQVALHAPATSCQHKGHSCQAANLLPAHMSCDLSLLRCTHVHMCTPSRELHASASWLPAALRNTKSCSLRPATWRLVPCRHTSTYTTSAGCLPQTPRK
jgi:hypothetical protein